MSSDRLILSLKADFQDALTNMQKVGQQLDQLSGKAESTASRTSSSFQKMGASIKQAADASGAALQLLGAGITAMVIKGLSETFQLEQSMNALRIVTENLGGSWAQQGPKIEAFTQQLAASAGIMQTQLVGAMQEAEVRGMNLAQSQRLVGAAAEFAAVTGKDLGTVENALLSYQQGRFLQAVRLGLVTRQEATDHENLGKVLDHMLAKIKDTSGYETHIRAIDRLHVQFVKLEENLASAVVPVFDTLIKVGNGAIAFAQKLSQQLGPTTMKFIDLGAAILGGAAAMNLLSPVLGRLSQGMGFNLVASIAKAIVQIVIFTANELAAAAAALALQVALNPVMWLAFGVAAVAAIGIIVTNLFGARDAAVGLLGAIGRAVGSVLGSIGKGIEGMFGGVIAKLKSDLDAFTSGFKQPAFPPLPETPYDNPYVAQHQKKVNLQKQALDAHQNEIALLKQEFDLNQAGFAQVIAGYQSEINDAKLSAKERMSAEQELSSFAEQEARRRIELVRDEIEAGTMNQQQAADRIKRINDDLSQYLITGSSRAGIKSLETSTINQAIQQQVERTRQAIQDQMETLQEESSSGQISIKDLGAAFDTMAAQVKASNLPLKDTNAIMLEIGKARVADFKALIEHIDTAGLSIPALTAKFADLEAQLKAAGLSAIDLNDVIAVLTRERTKDVDALSKTVATELKTAMQKQYEFERGLDEQAIKAMKVTVESKKLLILEEESAKLKELQDIYDAELKVLQKELGDTEAFNQAKAALDTQFANDQAQIQQNAETQIENINLKQKTEWDKLYQSMGDAVGSFVGNITQRHKALAQAFNDLVNQMLNSWTKMLSDMVAKWVQTGITNMVQSAFGGAGGGVGVAGGGGIGSISPGIGIIGTVTKAITAEGGASIRSYAAGGAVPILAHEGEHILNPAQYNALVGAATGGAGGGSTVTHNVTIQAMDSQDVAKWAMRNHAIIGEASAFSVRNNGTLRRQILAAGVPQ